MKYNEKFTQTPNFSRGRIIKPEGIILHHTSGSFKGSVNWCLRADAQVSYHCIVDLEGNRYTLAKDNQRAWHAGRSSWNGRNDCNSFMLGIAVSGDTNNRELTTFEIDSVAKWCVDKCKLHSISLANITTHAKVSPGRKTDVSEKAHEQIMHRIREILNLNC